MANFLRMLLGVGLLPACWAFARALADCVVAAAGAPGAACPEAFALVGGMAAFVLCWYALPRLTRTYVLGHELTHAIWGLVFGAAPSRLRVGASGGSVRLTKTNVFITLAPYFFPFYTFVVIVAALVVRIFLRPLPFLPLWTFMVGFTWAFHVLFTLETLSARQPDVTAYGRIFSWTFIFLMNLLLVMAWLAAVTPLGFGGMWDAVSSRTASAYVGLGRFARHAFREIFSILY
jgi:hypothetical protein